MNEYNKMISNNTGNNLYVMYMNNITPDTTRRG